MHLKTSLLISFVLCLIFAPHITQIPFTQGSSDAHECRMWSAIAGFVPTEMALDHLLNMPYSLKNLGAYNRNGWGLAYYNSTLSEPVVHRGSLPASEDPAFDVTVNETANSQPQIALGHVRAATSGLINVPNPHPFKRYKNGKWWLFAHNGGVSKTTLLELIGDEYLSENPPQVGSNFDEWIDSELYFIYALKCIEEHDWNVTRGMAEATLTILERTSCATMNFLLTNSEKLWGFCKGHTLYYSYIAHTGNSTQLTAIASQYPTATQGNWTMLNNFELAEVSKNAPPIIVDVRLVVMPPVKITAILKVSPSTLNLHGKGKTIDAYIELPETQNIADTNVSTIFLNNTIPAESYPIVVGDNNNNSVPDLKVRFNRTTIVSLMFLKGMTSCNVSLNVGGELSDGSLFEGDSVVKVSALIGDVNCDGKVSIEDLVGASTCHGYREGEVGWCADANFASLWNVVDILDLVTIAANYGEQCS